MLSGFKRRYTAKVLENNHLTNIFVKGSEEGQYEMYGYVPNMVVGVNGQGTVQ